MTIFLGIEFKSEYGFKKLFNRTVWMWNLLLLKNKQQ